MRILSKLANLVWVMALALAMSGCTSPNKHAASRYSGEMLVFAERGDEQKLREARELADRVSNLRLRGLLVEIDTDADARPTASLMYARRDEAPFELDLMLFAAPGHDTMDGWVELRETRSGSLDARRVLGRLRVRTDKRWTRVQVPIESLADAQEPIELAWISAEQR